jgi:hypothetical protein
LEGTATQDDDKPGGADEEQDIFQTSATRWHGQACSCGPLRLVAYHEDDGEEKGRWGGASRICDWSILRGGRVIRRADNAG